MGEGVDRVLRHPVIRVPVERGRGRVEGPTGGGTGRIDKRLTREVLISGGRLERVRGRIRKTES